MIVNKTCYDLWLSAYNFSCKTGKLNKERNANLRSTLGSETHSIPLTFRKRKSLASSLRSPKPAVVLRGLGAVMVSAQALPVSLIPEARIVRTADGPDMIDVFGWTVTSFTVEAGTHWIGHQEQTANLAPASRIAAFVRRQATVRQSRDIRARWSVDVGSIRHGCTIAGKTA